MDCASVNLTGRITAPSVYLLWSTQSECAHHFCRSESLLPRYFRNVILDLIAMVINTNSDLKLSILRLQEQSRNKTISDTVLR